MSWPDAAVSTTHCSDFIHHAPLCQLFVASRICECDRPDFQSGCAPPLHDPHQQNPKPRVFLASVIPSHLPRIRAPGSHSCFCHSSVVVGFIQQHKCERPNCRSICALPLRDPHRQTPAPHVMLASGIPSHMPLLRAPGSHSRRRRSAVVIVRIF